MDGITKLVKVGFFLAIVAALIVGISICREIFHGESKRAAEVTIAKGSSLNAVATILKKEGVIRSPKIFTLYARMRGDAGKLAAGDYDFPAGMSIADVLKKIVSGDVKRYQFTVIEGWNLDDIARMLAGNESFGPEISAQFTKLVHDTTFIESIGFGGLTSLEGYLFPDTYVVFHPHDVREVIDPMVRRFKEIYGDDFRLRAKNLGMTDHEVVTLASIIEKETGNPEERPLISSVFHNRLRQAIVLASDPTVIYGIADFDGNLRRSDIERPGPYNTYINPGLPPGPIASPGLASIEAALYPAKTDYLYFVSRNDGSHHFSKTMGEHSRAVIHFQKRRSDEPFEER